MNQSKCSLISLIYSRAKNMLGLCLMFADKIVKDFHLDYLMNKKENCFNDGKDSPVNVNI